MRKASTLKRSLLKNDMSTLTSIYDRNDLLDERTVKESSEDSLVGKRKLRAKEMARDVHAGMGDTLLMRNTICLANSLRGCSKKCSTRTSYPICNSMRGQACPKAK